MMLAFNSSIKESLSDLLTMIALNCQHFINHRYREAQGRGMNYYINDNRTTSHN